MSIKCNKCENKVFDSNAYLKISQMELSQQEKVNEAKSEQRKAELEYGKQSDEAVAMVKRVGKEIAVLQAITNCKNVL